jgi:hypothetical protein
MTAVGYHSVGSRPTRLSRPMAVATPDVFAERSKMPIALSPSAREESRAGGRGRNCVRRAALTRADRRPSWAQR